MRGTRGWMKRQADYARSYRTGEAVLCLLPLWEKVAVGGLRPPFFNRTPMLCIGYAKSVPDEGSLSIDRPKPLIRLRFATFSPCGRREVFEASPSTHRRRHPLCYSISRKKIQRHARNARRRAGTLRDRDQEVAAPRHRDADGGMS